MPNTLDDLATPLTAAEVQDATYAALASVGTNTTSWKPGAVVRTIIAIFAAVIAAWTAITARFARLGFADLSTGAWLRLVAWYVYRVAPNDATFATGSITLVNGSGGVYDEAIGDLIVTNPTTKKSYRNAEAFHLGALETITVAISAVEIGSASTAEPGDIALLTTPLNGVSCSNAGRVVGRDNEDDASLRARCGERLGALSPMGPWDAYSYAVKSALRSDGSALGVTRVRILKDGFGHVTVLLADAAGAIAAQDIDTANDAIARNAEPQCVTATAVSATALPVNVTYSAWLYNTSARTDAQIEQAIAASLSAFMARQPISGNIVPGDTAGKVFASSVSDAIGSAMSEIFRVTVAGGDVTVAQTEVPVLGSVTPTVIQVQPPEGHAQ